jgi:hypothetical protein
MIYSHSLIMQVKEYLGRGLSVPEISLRLHLYVDDVVYIISNLLT